MSSCESSQCVSSPPELNFILPTQKEIGSPHYEWESKKIQSQLPGDILLITATDYEFNSCYSYMKEKIRTWCQNVGIVNFGKFGEKDVKVSLIRSKMGPLPALIVVKNATEHLQPKVVLFVGICASLNQTKAKLGDVVISAKLATYASKKVTADGTPEHRGVRANVSRNIAQLILSAADGWRPPLKHTSSIDPKVHCQSVMLSGPELVDNDDRRQELLKYFPDAIGLEMEGEGLFAAGHELQIEWAVIKGVSDYADGRKKVTADWQPFASTMAASVVYNMFKYPDVIKHWPHYRKPRTAEVSVPGSQSLRLLIGCALALLIALLVYMSYSTPPPVVPRVVPTESSTSPQSAPIQQFLDSIAGTNKGTRVFNGRTIKYSVSGRIYSFEEPWVYDATATDVETGVFVKKKHFDTEDEAIFAAVEDLMKNLKERKIIKD